MKQTTKREIAHKIYSLKNPFYQLKSAKKDFFDAVYERQEKQNKKRKRKARVS